MICPDCDGEKRLKILPKIVKGQRLTDVKCLRCQCTGVVPDEQGEWSMIGECFRERMIECRVTLRAGAEMLGVSAMELSNARRGIIDPTPLAIAFETAIATERTPKEPPHAEDRCKQCGKRCPNATCPACQEQNIRDLNEDSTHA